MAQHEGMTRIHVDPRRHGGEPRIKGTRIPISIVIGSIADGDTVETVLNAYPALTPADIRAALQYAKDDIL